MVQQTVLAFDSEALLDTGGNPIINNSDTPNGTVFTYQGGFTAQQVTLDDTGGSPDVFDDDDEEDHQIIDGRGLVADNQEVESESVIVLRELDADGNQIGPNITVFVFSQGGVTQDVWGFATDTTLVPGTSYVKVTGSNLGDSEYADFVCFAGGTCLRTPKGPRAVEDIRPGDLVWTQRNGNKKVVWTGMRAVHVSGQLAPIRIAAGTFGNRAAVTLSPRHRVLVSNLATTLMFDLDCALVQARDLLRLDGVERVADGWVTYHHIMFDQHEIVDSDGLLCESFYAGAQSISLLDRSSRDELITLFPELANGPSAFGPLAAPTLRRFEGQVLVETLARQAA
ncbi:MAG: Hint domain-containing protein [Pseudomonadota bacterium]